MLIDSEAALEACIGKRLPAISMKVVDHVDDGARRWIEASTLAFVAFDGGKGIAITLAGGASGFATAPDRSLLSIAADTLDEPELAIEGAGFGALFVAPNIGETLRVNGRVVAVAGRAVSVTVHECYMHCAKALIRSDFWKGDAMTFESASDFLAASRFFALATVDAKGGADVSPKGDPAGTLLDVCPDGVWYPERPGNRRADSFRNILTQPRVALAALIPGSTRVGIVTGNARITTDEARRASFAVNGKTPLIATCIEQCDLRIRDSAALTRARLWPATTRADIDPAAVVAAHVKLNKAGGLQAALVRAAASMPRLVEKGLQQDYKTNLY